jgi:GNAT superfamily N-acetyltransferase
MELKSEYTIALARAEDVPWLPAIELAAATLLAGHAPASVLAETTSVDSLYAAQRGGMLWVARANGHPVGFAYVTRLESTTAHLAEIDVHPDHSRRGLGRRLVLAVIDWAAAAGYQWITLTTFRDVPWNMPFYERLGFTVVPETDLFPALRMIVEEQTRRGVDPKRRVAMRYRSSR